MIRVWIKWISYFLIFSLLITGIRACVNDPNLGEVTYGFPVVYMDSTNPVYVVNPLNLTDVIKQDYLMFHPPEMKNFYKSNLYINLIFWVIIFAFFYASRNYNLFVKYKKEISYGLFFVVLLIVSFFLSTAFGNKSFGYVSLPGGYILTYSGLFFESITNMNPIDYPMTHKKMLTFYPYVDDLPSRVGFIFAALAYFIFGVTVYRLKLGYTTRKSPKKSSPK